MVKNYMKYVYAFFLLFLISCQTVTIDTTIKRPSEVDMNKYNTVAIIKIDHDRNRYLTDEILGKVSQNGRLAFIDQQEIDRVIEYNVETISDAYSAEGASQIGQLVKADVVIFGKIKNEEWQDHEIVENQDFANFLYQDQDQEPVKLYSRKGYVSVTVSISVVNATTGALITQKNYTEYADTLYGKEENPDHLPQRLDLMPLYQRCCQRVATKFAKVVTPYEERLRVQLEKVDHPDFERGLAFARNGSWDKAGQVFGDIQEYAKKNQGVIGPEVTASAYFNYGVVLQYDNDFDRALYFLDIAYTSNPKSIYKKQIDECKRSKEDFYRLSGSR